MAKQMRVWIIDDDMARDAAKSFVPEPHEVCVSDPDDENFVDRLKESWDLILVDEQFGKESGNNPNVFDGSSLIGWLRAEARQPRSQRQLPCIALFTNKPDTFAMEVPAVGPALPLSASFVGREPHIAPVLDVEWLFSKHDILGEAEPEKVLALASAQREADENFKGNGASIDEFVAYLALRDDLPWHDGALSSISRARPPISEGEHAGEYFRGPVSSVRWLIHETLPFPGLFLSDRHVSCHLNISLEALDAIVDAGEGEWADALKSSIYQGPAASLFERRWWAAGISHAVLSLRGAMVDEESQFQCLQRLTILDDLHESEIAEPVVVVDCDMIEVGVEALDRCVRIRPRGWPPQCVEPWMLIEDARAAPWLKNMVDPSDQDLLETV